MFLYLEIFIAGKPCSEQQYLWVKESTSHLKESVWQTQQRCRAHWQNNSRLSMKMFEAHITFAVSQLDPVKYVQTHIGARFVLT